MLQDGYQILHIVWQFTLELQPFAARRVPQAQARGVQSLAWEAIDRGFYGRRQDPPPTPAATINGVPYERVPVSGQVNADLMGAAGGEPALHQAGRVLEDAQHAIARHRGP